MRTTLTIDDDILRAAKTLAAQQGQSLGAVVSELARLGLRREPRVRYEDGGLPVFEVREDAPVFGPEEVAGALDEE
jgi:hypothetical protein